MTDSPESVALVAGGTGGIGSAVCRALAARGHRVVVGYHRNADRAESLARELGGSSLLLELERPGTCEAACAGIAGLDVLVNCAGLNREAPAAGMDDETWAAVRSVNLDGAFALCRAAAKPMILNRRGSMVLFSSLAAVQGGRGQINYAASKAGVEAVVRILALELGRKGIRVNGIAPGVIETDMTDRIRRELSDTILPHVSLRRFGRPEEVAEVTAFLVSDAASYINGQIIRVDGGTAL